MSPVSMAIKATVIAMAGCKAPAADAAPAASKASAAGAGKPIASRNIAANRLWYPYFAIMLRMSGMFHYPLGRGRYPLGRGRYSMAGCITVTLVCNLIVRESNEGEDYHAK